MARLKLAHAVACKTKWDLERERERKGELPESWHLLISAGVRQQGQVTWRDQVPVHGSGFRLNVWFAWVIFSFRSPLKSSYPYPWRFSNAEHTRSSSDRAGSMQPTQAPGWSPTGGSCQGPTKPWCRDRSLSWNPSFSFTWQALGTCSSGINSPCPTGLEWPSTFSGFTGWGKKLGAESMPGKGRAGVPNASVITAASPSRDTAVLRRRQVPTFHIEGGVPSAHPETGEGLRLRSLRFHQAQAYESRGLLTVTVVRLSTSQYRLCFPLQLHQYLRKSPK